MKIICLSLFLLFILILHGCTFEPTGEQFVVLDQKGIEPNVEVKLNFNTDTIYISTNQWITFSYTPDGNQVNWAQFTIGDQKTELIEEKSGMLEMSRYFSEDDKGTFPLKMKLFLKSGTGSIADKVEAEGYLLYGNWTLVITDSYHMYSQIKNTEFVDGSLDIHWETFKGMDFKDYKIYKRVSNSTSASPILISTINSQEQTSFVDHTYHGENSNYYTVVNDKFYSPGVEVKGPLPVLSATNQANGNIVLRWNKPPFHKNLKGYRISYLNTLGNFQQLTEINDTETDSLVVPTPYFGYDYKFYLIMLPLSDNYYDDWTMSRQLSSNASATYGMPCLKFANAHTGIEPISYLLTSDNKILVFDQQTFTVQKTIQYDYLPIGMDLSANNKYMLSMLNHTATVYLEDLVEPANSKMLNLSTKLPLMGSALAVSDKGTGVIINGQSVVLYDFVNDKKLDEIIYENNGLSTINISPGGDFFFCTTYGENEYFQHTGQQINRLPNLNRLNEFAYYADYLPGISQKLVRVIGSRVEMLDCNTWTIEKTWTFDNQIMNVFNLDISSRKLFLRSGGEMILLDLETGARELLAITDPSIFLYSYNIFYNNRKIIWGQGKYIDLNTPNYQIKH